MMPLLAKPCTKVFALSLLFYWACIFNNPSIQSSTLLKNESPCLSESVGSFQHQTVSERVTDFDKVYASVKENMAGVERQQKRNSVKASRLVTGTDCLQVYMESFRLTLGDPYPLPPKSSEEPTDFSGGV